jgi:inner membrane protein
MEPVTHALASLALARAGQKQLPRFGTAMMLVAGVAPDLDYATYFAGPESFLRFHRAGLHSLPGIVLIAGITAVAFCVIDRKRKPAANAGDVAVPLAFGAAFIASAVGAIGHVLLDLASGVGAQLLWPFHVHLYAWNLLTNLDLWILIVLLAGLLLPLLLRLVSEEIGDRKKRVHGRTAAILALGFVVIYVGARAMLHSQAVNLLLSREYRGQVALSAGAFPLSSSPFDWRGVVVTDNTLEELNIAVGPHQEFDPDRSLTHYKPDDSPALHVAQQADSTQAFLRYVRFPLARMARQEDGYRFELHDLQFADNTSPDNIFVRVDMDSALHITSQQFLFTSHPNP